MTLNEFITTRYPDAASSIGQLSDREKEVLDMIGDGKPNTLIAQLMQLSPKTIETYREHIKRKLAIDNAMTLIGFATLWRAMEVVVDGRSA